MSFFTKHKAIKIGSVIFVAIGLFLLFVHNVDRSISTTDRLYLAKYQEAVSELPNPEQRTFEEELKLIRAIQQNVLTITPIGPGIPHHQSRRPRDVYEAGNGLCYDRSFLMELLFQELGFEVRHVSLFANSKKNAMLKELLTPGIDSHAISEVKTQQGWMIVDSNYPWIGLDIDGRPHSMKQVASDVEWLQTPPNELYREPRYVVYGLYSRHGKFYPPYNFIPDYYLRDLLYNF